ncbi:MAG: Fic/DOC family N-terminal domain-containing protein [Chloroflexota bacterium]|nr:Fic/DOC family N-terminal domain-containing protein [Chloroflexota bacterium]
MNPERFRNSTAGRPVRVGQGEAAYWAFVPHPLPPDLPADWEFARSLSEADRALSELAGVGRTMPNPHLLIGPFVRREAVLSSRIEGTQADITNLYAYEAGQLPLPGVEPAPPESDVREVLNYVRALEYGLERLDTLPVSLRLIRELHERLMTDVRGEYATPGEFRRSQNWIGPPNCTLNEARFVPPPVPQLLSLPLLYLSAYFYRYRQDYYDLLLAVSKRGDWRDWVLFFLRGVTSQAQDAIVCAKQLQDLQITWRERLMQVRTSALLLRLADSLFASPVITIPEAKRLLNVTYPSAQRSIEKLVRAGVLRPVDDASYGKTYLAAEILDIIAEQEKQSL